MQETLLRKLCGFKLIPSGFFIGLTSSAASLLYLFFSAEEDLWFGIVLFLRLYSSAVTEGRSLLESQLERLILPKTPSSSSGFFQFSNPSFIVRSSICLCEFSLRSQQRHYQWQTLAERIWGSCFKKKRRVTRELLLYSTKKRTPLRVVMSQQQICSLNLTSSLQSNSSNDFRLSARFHRQISAEPSSRMI